MFKKDDYVTRVVITTPDGQTFEKMHHGFDGSSGLVNFHMEIAEKHGIGNTELFRYVPSEHAQLALDAFSTADVALRALYQMWSQMSGVLKSALGEEGGDLAKSFIDAMDEMNTEVLNPIRGKIDELLDSYKPEPDRWQKALKDLEEVGAPQEFVEAVKEIENERKAD